MTVIYLVLGFICISIGAVIGLCIGSSLRLASRNDDQDDEFYRVTPIVTPEEYAALLDRETCARLRVNELHQ